jgi:hypothetical protein
MNEKLRKLSELLREGQRRSMQGSYERRSPAPASLPFLTQARTGLRELVKEDATKEAFELLSQAEEALLDYPSAVKALERAIEISGKRDGKTLKRLALLRGAVGEWAVLRLRPEQLRALGEFLAEKLQGGEGDRTLRWTRLWLREQALAEADKIVQSLEARGAFDDWQVLHNVAGM